MRGRFFRTTLRTRYDATRDVAINAIEGAELLDAGGEVDFHFAVRVLGNDVSLLRALVRSSFLF